MSELLAVTREVFDEVMVPNYAPAKIIPVRGEGSRVWDQEGREYVDFAGGIAVNGLGHCHPKLVEALKTQGEKLWHLSNVMTNEPALRLAKKLVAATFAEKVYFCNSGAEANEAALKLARRYAIDKFGAHKTQIIAFHQGFHGRTFFTVSVGGQAAYSDGFGPKPADITHVTYNDLAELAAVISDNTCAVVMEPLQGEGGIIRPTDEFGKGVRELCDKHNALLVYDEVQSGVGRTGELFAYMGLGITPDILTLAKGISNACVPLGATIMHRKISDNFKETKNFPHGFTYSGHALACAAGLAAINAYIDEKIPENAAKVGAYFIEALQGIQDRHRSVGDVRGLGLIEGVEFVKNKETKEPLVNPDPKAPPEERPIMALSDGCLKEGLLIMPAMSGSTIRMAPPLIITEDDVNEAAEILEKHIAIVEKKFL